MAYVRLLSAAALWGLLAACASAPGPQSAALDGPALLERACTTCHDLGGLEGYKGYWGEPQWRDMVATMRDHGAVLDDQEAEVLVAWLTTEYGPGSE